MMRTMKNRFDKAWMGLTTSLLLMGSNSAFAVTFYEGFKERATSPEGTLTATATNLGKDTGLFGQAATIAFIAAFALGVFFVVMGLIKLSQSKRDGGSPGDGVKMILIGAALSIVAIIIGMAGHLIVKGA